MIRRWSAGQWVLRAVVVAGIVGALLATGPAGDWPAWWLVAVVGGLAAGLAVLPDTPIGTVAMALVLAWWGTAFGEDVQPQVLLAAAGLVVAHCAAVVAAYGPGELAVDPTSVRQWARRAGLVFLTAPLMYLAWAVLRDRPEPAAIWTAGLAVALVVTVAAGAVWRRGDA